MMKKFDLFLTVIILIVTITGCDEYEPYISISCISTTHIEEDKYLSSVFSNSNIIRLETIEESLIGKEIDKIRKRDNRYFISYDKEVIVVFDSQGKFLFRIKNKGNGPGEYVSLQDFDVLPDGNIIVLDMKKLLVYSVEGEFLKVIPLDINCWNIKVIDENNFLVCAGREDYCIYLIDGEGMVLSKQMKKNNLPFLRRSVPFSSLGNNIMYQQDVSNDFLSFNIETKNFVEVNFLCKEDRILDIRTVREQQKRNPMFISTDYVEKSYEKIIMGNSSYNDCFLFSVGKPSSGYKYFLMNTTNNTIDHLLTENTVDDISFTSIKILLNRSMTGTDSDDCLLTYLWPYQIMDGLNKNINLNDHPNYKYLHFLIENTDDIEEENPYLIELRK